MPGLSGFRSRFFWKLFASYCALVAVTAAIVANVVGGRLEDSARQELKEALAANASILMPFAERALAGEEDRAREDIARMRAESGYRVTLIAEDGRVVGDSHEDPIRMDDHGRRIEIVDARATGAGSAVRASRTVGYEMLYFARRVGTADAPLGYVRVAMPLQDVEERHARTWASILLATGIGLVIAFAIGLGVARRITSPLTDMTRVASDMIEGRYESRTHAAGNDEIGLLGEALNRLGRELTDRIATISQDDAQLRAMLASMVEGVVAIDEDDRITFCNAAARAALSIPADAEASGVRLWEAARAAELEELVEGARERGAVTGGELEFAGDDRSLVLEAHASAFAGGGAQGLVVVLHDVTELRRLERVRRDFVANVSHELKTPLTSIKGYVETLLAGALNDEANNERFVRRIHVNVERLNTLVSDLLSLARIESQMDAIPVGPVDWCAVVADVVRRHEPAMSAKDLECVLRAPEGEVVVTGDREAMTQVVDNLVSNAVKYTPDGGRVDVELAARDDVGVLVVADTGVGIPPADIERIFERFYRVDRARSRALGGTGLGLSIVKNLVLSMNGSVDVESEPGRGSRFTVALPLRGAADPRS